MSQEELEHVTAKLTSARDLASRWRCHRSTVARILESAGIRPYYLGQGKKGVKRYRQDEVDEFMKGCRSPR